MFTSVFTTRLKPAPADNVTLPPASAVTPMTNWLGLFVPMSVALESLVVFPTVSANPLDTRS